MPSHAHSCIKPFCIHINIIKALNEFLMDNLNGKYIYKCYLSQYKSAYKAQLHFEKFRTVENRTSPRLHWTVCIWWPIKVFITVVSLCTHLFALLYKFFYTKLKSTLYTLYISTCLYNEILKIWWFHCFIFRYIFQNFRLKMYHPRTKKHVTIIMIVFKIIRALPDNSL